MAAKTRKKIAAQPDLASQIFAISTRKYGADARELLPAGHKIDLSFGTKHAAQIAKLAGATEINPPQKSGKLLSGIFSGTRHRLITRAAGVLMVFGAGWGALHFFGDDSLHIEDEMGKSALNAEHGNYGKSVSLKLMRRRSKIGEITVSQGTKLKIVRGKHNDAFVVSNGPYTAKVRIPKNGKDDVHLKFDEVGSLLPVGKPEFAIEVIKGNVQIAEIDDDDDFEQYKGGEKAIFTLSPDSESL